MTPRLALLFAAAAVAASAPQAAAQSTLGWLRECAPADFASFPEGTSRIRVSHASQRGNDALSFSWEFEFPEGCATLAPRDARTEWMVRPPAGTVFPAAAVDPGPMQVAAEFMRAIAAGNRQVLRASLSNAAAAKFDADPESSMARYEAGLAESGVPRDRVDEFLPKLLFLQPRTAALDLRYSFAALSGGGETELTIGLGVVSEGRLRWAVSNFELSARSAKDARSTNGKVAAKGLASVAMEFRIADLGGFPGRTGRIDVESWFSRDKAVFQAKARFAALAPDSEQVILTDLKVRRRDAPPEGSVIPLTGPAEGPIDSAIAYLAATAAFDVESAAGYLPMKVRKDFVESSLARGIEALRANSVRLIEKSGYDPVETAAKNLPSLLGLPRNCGFVKVEYGFHGVVKEMHGVFAVSFSAFVEDEKAEHWVMDGVECDFEVGGTKR